MRATPSPLTGDQLAHARHELRTPVNAIIGYSEMLLEDADPDQHPESAAALNRIQQLGKQLQALIGEHLDTARLQSQPALNGDLLAAQVRRAMSRRPSKLWRPAR